MNPGAILAEKYQLISLIGQGGMGSVWEAEHLAWRSPVAVKLMHRAAQASPEVLARFRAEARLAASLRSPHVVQILDDGCDAASGTPFIVMERLLGESLAQRLARVKRLSPAETARIVSQVARALRLAHEAQLVHRDLKPANIFLVQNDDEELVKVLDFGIAKWNAESLEQEAATLTGAVMGTPYYMSPEQISDSKRVDHRSDLWSLASIAYECLTGCRPFQADSLLALALLICSVRAPRASSLCRVPDGFDAWFERATAIDPAARFASAREFAAELRTVCGTEPGRHTLAAAERTLAEPEPAAGATVVLDAPIATVSPLSRTRSVRAPGLDPRRLVLAAAGLTLLFSLVLGWLWPSARVNAPVAAAVPGRLPAVAERLADPPATPAPPASEPVSRTAPPAPAERAPVVAPIPPEAVAPPAEVPPLLQAPAAQSAAAKTPVRTSTRPRPSATPEPKPGPAHRVLPIAYKPSR